MLGLIHLLKPLLMTFSLDVSSYLDLLRHLKVSFMDCRCKTNDTPALVVLLTSSLGNFWLRWQVATSMLQLWFTQVGYIDSVYPHTDFFFLLVRLCCVRLSGPYI